MLKLLGELLHHSVRPTLPSARQLPIAGDAVAASGLGSDSRGARDSEAGFTLIELLISLSIIGILAALSLTAFFVYKDKAEYAKAETDLRTSLVAFIVGDQDAVAGDSLALTYTNQTGGSVPAAMEQFLPKAVTSKGVEIGAQYQYCDSTDPPFQVKMYLTAESCLADKRVEWTKFCGGTEVRLENLPGGHC